ncbi:MAG: nucleoid-associated protein [Bacteroidetes bacterium]|nr:MAG: nucleoid-associated protein [Bacteroidota bacterium]
MLNYSTIQIQETVIHRVGNKHRAEKNFISEALFPINPEIEQALLHYFLKPIKKSQELYRFQHASDLKYNEVYGYCQTIFEDRSRFLEQSGHILSHLYNQSNHPNIKSGEVYIVYFTDLLIDDELVDAIGIFKSERKSTFIKVIPQGNALAIDTLEGIHIDKLDKGCLVVNSNAADGFRVLTVDNNNYDALYWTHHFLNVDFVEDENFHTKLYLEMCQEFSQEVVAEKGDRREQVQFLANSMDYFSKNEVFNFDEFKDQVLTEKPELKEELKSFQEDFGLENADRFPISQPVLKSAKRKIKNTIKLDTNIQIKLDLNDPENSARYIEKGFDEEKGMYFYKVYFNEEKD